MEKDFILKSRNFAKIWTRSFMHMFSDYVFQVKFNFVDQFFCLFPRNFLYVMILYNCLRHSLITSFLATLNGPRFLSVSLINANFYVSVFNQNFEGFFLCFRHILFLHQMIFEKDINFIPNVPAKVVYCCIFPWGNKITLRQK